MNRNIGIFFLGIVCAFLYSCGPTQPDKTSTDSSQNNKPFRVVLVTDVGGRGDKGFNDAGWMGCEDAKRRLAERGIPIEIKAVESREQTDYVDNLNLAADRAEVVVALGFLIAESVKQVAELKPNRSFIFIDGRITGENIASFDFKTQEAAFLAGILSGYVTQTDVVGVIPGMDIPPVEAFASGYRAGVMTCGALLGKERKTVSATIGSFNDPVKGKSIALSLMSRQADILFQLAGNSGLGVIEAVKDAPGRCFAVGVDIDQDDLAPGKILTSVLKRMDRVVSDQIIAVYDQTFQNGIFDVGLKDGYVGLTEMKHTKSLVPAEAFPVMDKARNLIITGQVMPPKTYNELNQFQPPVQLLRGS